MARPAAHDAATGQPDLGVNQEGCGSGLVRHHAHRAYRAAAEMDLPVSGSRLRKIVRRYVREGRFDIDFRTWFISYADPTGEIAVKNVMKERKF